MGFAAEAFEVVAAPNEPPRAQRGSELRSTASAGMLATARRRDGATVRRGRVGQFVRSAAEAVDVLTAATWHARR